MENKNMHTQVFGIVKYFKLVIMRMSEELSCNGRFVSVDYGVIVATPDLQTIGVTWWYVSDYVHLFTVKFGRLQLVYKPLQLGGRVGAVQQQPPMHKCMI